jgi:hypothetical protein
MLERACPCVASGLQKSTSSTGPLRRVSPSKRARGRRSSFPPTSDLPGTERARGQRRRIGSRETGESGKPDAGGERDAGWVPGMHSRSRSPRTTHHSRGWSSVRVPRPAGLGFAKWSSSMKDVSGRRSRFAVTRGSGEAAFGPHGALLRTSESDSLGKQGTRVDDSEASEARSSGTGRKKTPPESSWARRSGSIVVKTIDSSILVATGSREGASVAGAAQEHQAPAQREAVPSGSSETRVHDRDGVDGRRRGHAS